MLLGIDVGGTFTDFALHLPGRGKQLLHKEPSTPGEPDRAIASGIETLLATNRLTAANIARIAHGTTVGTNALIQRRIGRVALVTTEGFKDLLEIGRQTRPKMYDEHVDRPTPLIPRQLRFEVPERMLADGTVFRALDENAVRHLCQTLREAEVDAVVVCFLHSYAFPDHERRAAAILRAELPPDVDVVTSASVYSEFREYERLSTTVLNAALMTVMDRYLENVGTRLEDLGVVSPLRISHSAGGLMSVQSARRVPVRASLSGPAAGVLGAGRQAAAAGFGDIITLDMGGTSADVSLLNGGQAVEVYDRELAGFPLRLPALDVNAVGAGGGSVAWLDRDGLLKVGPRSAGADPGPACYGLGAEEPTVTDANVVLGRLNPQALLGGAMPIDKSLAVQAVETLAGRLGLNTVEAALGIVRIASATMVNAIRTISVERGHDPRRFVLFAFGGAGPLHATEVARALGIARVVVPANPGILCAEGLLASDLRTDFIASVLTRLTKETLPDIEAARAGIEEQAARWSEVEGVEPADLRIQWTLDMRYVGQNYELGVALPPAPLTAATYKSLRSRFDQAHESNYGFASVDEPIELVNLRARAVGRLEKPAPMELEPGPLREPDGHRDVCFSGRAWVGSGVWQRRHLAAGQCLDGPAIVEQLDTTVPVYPGSTCNVDRFGNLIIEFANQL